MFGPERLKIAKQKFQYMLELGIIRPSSSTWASPLHMVLKKATGDWHSCGDYRALNNTTIPARYPILHIQDFTATLHGATIFLKLYLVRVYHQIPVEPSDVPKTAVIMPFGLFDVVRMPFGLQNVDQTFHGLGTTWLDIPYNYIDDLLIASKDSKEHKIHLCIQTSSGSWDSHKLIKM